MADSRRLIDAELYGEFLHQYIADLFEIDAPMVAGAIERCLSKLNAQPTVDPVHAAGGCYCRECKYYTEKKHRCDHPCQDYDVECYDQWVEMNPADFCSQGERRTDHEKDSYIV